MSTTSARVGLGVAAVTGLTASFLTGMVVAGGFGPTVEPPIGTSPTPPQQPPLRLVNADLTVPGSCEELLASYVERGQERVTPYGWDYPLVAAAEGSAGSGRVDPLRADSESAADAAGVVEQGSSATGTNVQEVGVDEPDVVKTDGRLLARVLDGDLVLHDVTGPKPVELGGTELPDDVPADAAELLLAGDTVVVLGSKQEQWQPRGTTHVVSYDVSDPTAPVMVDHRSWDADLVQAVQHDDDVRLVLRSGLPDLDFVQPRWWRGDDAALKRNREVVGRSTIEDWLPAVTRYGPDGTSTRPLDCSSITVPAADDAALGTVAVVGFDVDDPEDADTLGVAADTGIAYFSPTRLYLVTTGWSSGCCWTGPVEVAPGATSGRSRLYAFELDGTDASYVASGAVDGVIADRWSMDEHDGVLRVAVGPSAETGNFNSVLTLTEDGDALEVVGRVDKLGVGEEIKSVRWFDGLAIVVTFRQVDPLYAVDLTRPRDPRLLGELKIPGFSEYLHPISGQRLVGMGQDADQRGMVRGAQASLFDVSDLTAPRRTDVVTYGRDTVAGAAADPRQFTWLPGRDTALTVISQGWEGRTGWVSVLDVDGSRLANRMVEVEYGTDVDTVRLVPLPDGRVVLLTGEDVSFFDV